MAEPVRSPALEARRAQMFPLLASAEIARMRPFGAVRRYAEDDHLSEAVTPAAVVARIHAFIAR